MFDFKIFWKDAEAGDICFAAIDLLYCPRIGETIQFSQLDEAESDFGKSYTLAVEDVLHVAEGEDDAAYVELMVCEYEVEDEPEREPVEYSSPVDYECEECGHMPGSDVKVGEWNSNIVQM